MIRQFRPAYVTCLYINDEFHCTLLTIIILISGNGARDQYGSRVSFEIYMHGRYCESRQYDALTKINRMI